MLRVTPKRRSAECFRGQTPAARGAGLQWTRAVASLPAPQTEPPAGRSPKPVGAPSRSEPQAGRRPAAQPEAGEGLSDAWTRRRTRRGKAAPGRAGPTAVRTGGLRSALAEHPRACQPGGAANHPAARARPPPGTAGKDSPPPDAGHADGWAGVLAGDWRPVARACSLPLGPSPRPPAPEPVPRAAGPSSSHTSPGAPSHPTQACGAVGRPVRPAKFTAFGAVLANVLATRGSYI